MTVYYWEGKVLFRFGKVAKGPDCCCGDEGCPCCQLAKDIRLTIDAPGCCIDGEVIEAPADEEDVWTGLSIFGCAGCESDDGIFFEVRCVGGEYRLGMNGRQTFEPFTRWCWGTAIDCDCDVGSGNFRLVFELECDWCCPGTTITIVAETFDS